MLIRAERRWHTINSNLSHSARKSLMHRKNMDDAIQIDVSGVYARLWAGSLANMWATHTHTYTLHLHDRRNYSCKWFYFLAFCRFTRHQSGAIECIGGHPILARRDKFARFGRCAHARRRILHTIIIVVWIYFRTKNDTHSKCGKTNRMKMIIKIWQIIAFPLCALGRPTPMSARNSINFVGRKNVAWWKMSQPI